MDRRSEPPDPRKVRLGSNRDKGRIPFLRYEYELVPRGRLAIKSLQKERTAIKIRWQREHSHTHYSPHDTLRSPQPPIKNYLKEAIHPSGSGGHNLPSPREGGEKERTRRQRKENRNVHFCVAYSHCFSTAIHRVINRLKKSFNLTWLRVRMSYHRDNNLAEILNEAKRALTHLVLTARSPPESSIA